MKLCAFVATFIFRDDAVLLLERSPARGFAPGKWTGVGGRVETHEMGDVLCAALREIREETGLGNRDLRGLAVRYVLTQPEAGGVSVLFFCTAETDRVDVGPCDEGALHWVPTPDLGRVHMIDNARRVLNLLVEDRRTGHRPEAPRFGVCRCDAVGEVVQWAAI